MNASDAMLREYALLMAKRYFANMCKRTNWTKASREACAEISMRYDKLMKAMT